MKKLLSTFLFTVSLLALLSLSAEARIVIGVVKSSSLSAPDRLAEALSVSMADNVQVRQFDNEATLSNWLIRFQELDTAIVSQGYIAKQPAGTLRHLADLHLKSSPTPLSVVSLRTLGSKPDTIQKALVELGNTAQGKQALAAGSLAGFTLPGKQPKPTAAKQRIAPAKQVPAKTEPEPVKEEISAPPKKVEQKKDVQELKPVKTVTPKKLEPAPVKKTTQPKTKEEAAAQKPTFKEEPTTVAEPKQQPVDEDAVTTPPLSEKPTEAQPSQSEQLQQKKKSPVSKRLILFIALIILVAILLKITLLVMRWQSRQRVIRKSAPPPSGEDFTTQTAPVPAEKLQEEAEHEPLVVENGFLGPGKVPTLLKRCADLPEPVVLQVTKGSCEKLIYFAAGQVSGAMTHNTSVQESGIRWNKLGSMLLREEFITVEERDQAMGLIVSEPNLRFGEALLKLGYITLAELRHALTRQAKITIYSLILFPEGKYKVFAEEGSLPAEESVALEVTSLIREASHHQSEWMAIREALPNLNKALDFTAEGKEKVEQVNLSAQQQEILSQIDGKLSINELSANSSMMDYEVYRFLYMMVKAGVLQ
jgi:hypothetical protein